MVNLKVQLIQEGWIPLQAFNKKTRVGRNIKNITIYNNIKIAGTTIRDYIKKEKIERIIHFSGSAPTI